MEAIDLKEVIRKKSPSLAKKLPNFVIKLLGKIIHIDEINFVLEKYKGKEGIDFVNSCLEYFNIKTNVVFEDESSIDPTSKYVFVSNHPLGGLDGLVITSEITKRYGPAKFIVNDILMGLEPLRDIFVPVNNLGTASNESIMDLKNLFKSEFQVLNFPSGACSRLIDGKIQDLEWRKSFVKESIHNNRPIIPIFFGGKNSKRFYRVANWRKKIGIKGFIEMILLPDEMFRQRNAQFDVVIGKPILPDEIKESGLTTKQWCEKIREKVYSNGTRYSTYR